MSEQATPGSRLAYYSEPTALSFCGLLRSWPPLFAPAAGILRSCGQHRGRAGIRFLLRISTYQDGQDVGNGEFLTGGSGSGRCAWSRHGKECRSDERQAWVLPMKGPFAVVIGSNFWKKFASFVLPA